MKKKVFSIIAIFIAVFFNNNLSAQWVQSSLQVGHVNTLFTNGNDLLAGFAALSGGGIIVTQNNDIYWSYASSGIPSGTDVRSFGANSSYVFAGTQSGLFRCNNDGNYNWNLILNGGYWSILVNGNEIFAGTLGAGLFYSSDNGNSWTSTTSGMQLYPYVYALASNSNYIFAGMYAGQGIPNSPNAGVYRSSDNGQTWSQIVNGLSNRDVFSLLVKGNYIFAGTNGGLFRSSDNGNSWTLVAGGSVHSLKLICGKDIYAGLLNLGGVIRSTDNGNTWTSYGMVNYAVGSLSFLNSYLYGGTFGTGIYKSEIICDSTFGSICGMKFNDLNRDGIKDLNEPGIFNWGIALANSPASPPIEITYTDSNGHYCFNYLEPGTYFVTEINQQGWTQTFPSQGNYALTLQVGENVNNIDFGNMVSNCPDSLMNWSSLGSGINNGTNGEIWALAKIGNDLYVGGNFSSAGGIPCNNIAKWDGASWSALISGGINGINGSVTALASNGTDLYIGGWFTSAGNVSALNIAKWDGSNFSQLGNGIASAGTINDITFWNNDLFVTSYILDPSLGGPGNLIAKWNGTNWNNFALMDDYVNCLYSDGTNLYAGGQFNLAGTTPASKIAMWDGTNWQPLGVGTNYWIGADGIIKDGNNLYVGGRFTFAGNIPANFIARWDGSSWSSFGSGNLNGMNNQVEALLVNSGYLYASGSFTTAQGVYANNIAKWNGTNWTPLGSGMNDGVWRMIFIGDDLYAAGIFTTAGGVNANHIAKYSCNSSLLNTDGNQNKTLPRAYELSQNYPNPFNPSTTINYSLPEATLVKIVVFDVLGREVKILLNEYSPAGNHQITFNASEFSSGIYFYKIITEHFSAYKKMILIK
jgi:hypothetical protein